MALIKRHLSSLNEQKPYEYGSLEGYTNVTSATVVRTHANNLDQMVFSRGKEISSNYIKSHMHYNGNSFLISNTNSASNDYQIILPSLKYNLSRTDVPFIEIIGSAPFRQAFICIATTSGVTKYPGPSVNDLTNFALITQETYSYFIYNSSRVLSMMRFQSNGTYTVETLSNYCETSVTGHAWKESCISIGYNDIFFTESAASNKPATRIKRATLAYPTTITTQVTAVGESDIGGVWCCASQTSGITDINYTMQTTPSDIRYKPLYRKIGGGASTQIKDEDFTSLFNGTVTGGLYCSNRKVHMAGEKIILSSYAFWGDTASVVCITPSVSYTENFRIPYSSLGFIPGNSYHYQLSDSSSPSYVSLQNNNDTISKNFTITNGVITSDTNTYYYQNFHIPDTSMNSGEQSFRFNTSTGLITFPKGPHTLTSSFFTRNTYPLPVGSTKDYTGDLMSNKAFSGGSYTRVTIPSLSVGSNNLILNHIFSNISTPFNYEIVSVTYKNYQTYIPEAASGQSNMIPPIMLFRNNSPNPPIAGQPNAFVSVQTRSGNNYKFFRYPLKA